MTTVTGYDFQEATNELVTLIDEALVGLGPEFTLRTQLARTKVLLQSCLKTVLPVVGPIAATVESLHDAAAMKLTDLVFLIVEDLDNHAKDSAVGGSVYASILADDLHCVAAALAIVLEVKVATFPDVKVDAAEALADNPLVHAQAFEYACKRGLRIDIEGRDCTADVRAALYRRAGQRTGN